MSEKNSTPGIDRQQRISDEGLQRLARQLQTGAKMSAAVRQQWIKRYGADAEALFARYLRLETDASRKS